MVSSFRRFDSRGVSLAESIVACFVLTFAMLVTSALYHSALQHSVRIDRKQRAARVAQQRIEEIKSWSRAHHGTNGDLEFTQGWAQFDNATTTNAENPGYSIETKVETKALFSPSSEFEQINFAAMEDENIPDDSVQQRQIEASSYLTTVKVSWGNGPTENITTRTLITDPVRDHGWAGADSSQAINLEYSQGGSWSDTAPSVLSPNSSLRLRAFIEDKAGKKIKNPVVTWYLDPDSTGKGTIISFPDKPDQARFINEVVVDVDPDTTGDELTVLTGGQAVIVARVRLGGKEAVQKSPKITLVD